MAELLDFMRVWIEQIILLLGYPGIALIMLVENLFPPIPSEFVMPLLRGIIELMAFLSSGSFTSGLGASPHSYLAFWSRNDSMARALTA